MAKRKPLAPQTRSLVRNLLQTKSGLVLAGYRIGDARWDFIGQDPKYAAIIGSADVFSALSGRLYHERVSTRPHPVQQWAENLDRRTPNPTPDVHTCDLSMNKGDLLMGRCGCETFGLHLARQQWAIASAGMDDKVVFRYFGLNVAFKGDLRSAVNNYLTGGKPSSALTALLEDEKRVADIVAGWRGSRRMNEFEQGWLRVRSMSPGVQPVAAQIRSTGQRKGWDNLSMPAMAADIGWDETPFSRSVNVTSFVGGKAHETAVRVLTVARLSDLHYPENGLDPWQIHAEKVRDSTGRSFPVEWSISGRLRGGEEMIKDVELELKIAQNTENDYREHGERPPAAIGHSIATAVDTRDQVTTGRAMEAARFQGQINVIISGQARYDDSGNLVASAAEVVEERCASFARLYGSSALAMDFVGDSAQAFMLNSTVPGEPHDMIGYNRRIRLPYLAAGMANVSSTIGDGAGPYIGRTAHGSRAVQHDPHFATEALSTGRQQNMNLIIGSLGSGKSVLEGMVGYESTRRGIRTIISDPSGPLAALCRMPELAAVSQEINLLHGARGILTPAALIRTPQLGEFDEPGQYAEAVEQARAERRDLMVDMAMRCLAEDLVDDAARSRSRHALRVAARMHADRSHWESTSTMWDLMRGLAASGDEHSLAVEASLREASTAPLLRLLFTPEGELPPVSQYDKTLTVITTPGIDRADDGTPRRDWNPMEVGADAVLRLVGLFTNRLIYTKARSERCVAIFDEAESLTDFGPGRSMLSRLGRDHSKWNVAVYLATKSINDRMLSGELKNFLSTVFVGRMASAAPAAEALALIGLEDQQYVDILLGLSTVTAGEFVHKDVAGNVGRFKVDVEHNPNLKAALLTDPTPEGSSSWAIEEDVL